MKKVTDKAEEPKMKKITVPQQKTFLQGSPEKLDIEVNAWLLDRAKRGLSMPMHGKSYSAPYTHENPDHCAVYYYVEPMEVEDNQSGGSK